MSRRIAVAGATGVVGRALVEILRARGRPVVPMSRATGVDLAKNQGLHAALAGVDTVVDVSSRTTGRAGPSIDYFGHATRNLLEAERHHGVGHHVVLSIVGTDRVQSGYYEGKLVQERLTMAAPVPFTILRATQFHEFAEQMLRRMRIGPVAIVPKIVMQPVAAYEVAQRLADLVEAGPSGRVPDMAGPQRHTLLEMTRKACRANGDGAVLVPVRIPGPGGRLMANGGLLPDGRFDCGQLTFDDWLARRSARGARTPMANPQPDAQST
ncbi:MAG TPA: NAD(P)H-binding protein [Jiangellales bacterium]|nr:NAD(P)H-binding protein [Jiangellales bacterium]